MLGGPQGDREAGPCIVADFSNGSLIRPSGRSILLLRRERKRDRSSGHVHNNTPPIPPKRSPASAAATAKLNVGFRIAHYLLGKDAANDRQQLHESADMASGRREVDQWPVPAHNRRHEVATGVGRWTMAWYSAVGEMGHRPPAYHHKRRRSQGRAGAWVG